ncbi:hypothetical protein [Dactylosporangium sp. NPDC051541]|uniref:hypothetical protein n=1 Tax=Dactylosporangium sp. NPDC051541 TaxID=3363977 RepID=UPI00379CED35
MVTLRFLPALAVLALGLAGCTGPGPVTPSGPAAPSAGRGPTASPAPLPGVSGRPPELGTALVRYTGRDASGGVEQGVFVVTPDGQGAALQAGERVFIRMTADEVDALRRALVDGLKGIEGGHDDPGGADRPAVQVTVLGLDGRIHWASYTMNRTDRPAAFQAAVDRVTVLKARAAQAGTPDPGADIVVQWSPGAGTVDGPRATWPSKVPLPAGFEGDEHLGRYNGDQAAALRRTLGPPERDRVVNLPDGSAATVRWRSVF